MDLNNIKRNNLDYLLTDILPTELSDRFTYSYFYEFLLKLFSSKVPFVLDGWLNETNGFTNRMCDMLFTSKEEQKAYVEKISAKSCS